MSGQTGSNANKMRVFEEIVSVNAWSSPKDNNGHSSVHVDVSFSSGRLGQDSECKVHFRLALRRADLIFSISETEPLKVVQSSVAREPIDMKTTTSKTTTTKNAKAALGFGLKGSTGFEPTLTADGLIAGEKVQKVDVDGLKTQAPICWQQTTNSKGEYRWSFQSTDTAELSGRPWNPVKSPILITKDTRETTTRSIAPTSHVRIICKKEDFIVSDIEIKQKTYLGLDDLLGRNTRNAAAQAFIRQKISEYGLHARDFDDRFGDIEIANIIVDDEVV